AHGAAEIKTTGKDIPIGCPATALEPCGKTAASVSGNLELHRSSCFLLDDESAVPNIGARHKITDFELHQVTAAQLALDGKVEQRAIAEPLLSVEEEADRPDLLLGERPLRSHRLSGIPGRAVVHHRVQVRVGHHHSPWPGLAMEKNGHGM